MKPNLASFACIRLGQVPTNLQLALTAMVTLPRAKTAGCSDRLGHLMACSKAAYLYSIIQQVLANNFGVSLLRSLRACSVSGQGVRSTNPWSPRSYRLLAPPPQSQGPLCLLCLQPSGPSPLRPQGPLFGVTRDSHEERHTYRNAY